MLNGESLAYDVGQLDGGVVGEDKDFLARELPAIAPRDRILVHRQARVARVVNERVAHGLEVSAISAHVVIAMHAAMHAVGIDVECLYAQRVGVHVERVFLREIHDEGLLGGESLARLLVVSHFARRQLVLVFRVDEHHVAITMVAPRGAVIKQRVARDGLLLVHHRRTAVETRPVGLGVEEGVGGLHHPTLVVYD